ncbi:Nuclear control of ATPase protein 2 [Lunasporangiospora selenospora]|uniref:Nuclear control of ATPase protein 2 n=1 Tax=Lunasporangiospora selenospora TaxID=979761 RepID=A0A9P6KFU2_9FUNG|nr:Nuclear control of ATPase protein 2 [Lunasporangiospora selenospora]
MGTFIADKLQHLNNDLVQLFHLDAQPPLDDNSGRPGSDNGSPSLGSPPSSKQTGAAPNTAQNEHTQSETVAFNLVLSLRASVNSLDLRSGSVPSMDRVLAEIEKVQTAVASATSNNVCKDVWVKGSQVSKLEHLFLAKCTIAVYLNLLDIILNATLPLATEIQYWQSLLDSTSWRAFYILQTAPHRAYLLTKEVIQRTHEHLDKLLLDANGDQMAEHRSSLLQLMQYFPSFLSQYIITRPVSFHVAVHYEVAHRRHKLQQIREYQAECLGLLAEQGLNLDPESILTGERSEDVEDYVQEHISRTLCLVERVLNKASNDMVTFLSDPQQQKVMSRKAVARSLTILGNMSGVSNLSSGDMFIHLRDLIRIQIPHYMEQTENQARLFYRPHWLTRVWIPVFISYFGLKYGIAYVTEHRADLDKFLDEAWDTAKRFVTDWVWEPSMRIMSVIRHGDDQGSLQMLGNESLQSDIANPLRGAIQGNLIQTLLIQVQKTKVDVEVAMAALDKLLKANELNFAFLAVSPSLLLLWAASAQVKNYWQRAAGRNLGVVSLQMRNSLRQVERLLNLASADTAEEDRLRVSTEKGGVISPRRQRQLGKELEDYDDLSASSATSTPTEEELQSARSSQPSPDRLMRMRAKKGMVPYRAQGLILCEVHLLRTFARRLTRSGGLRDKFMEDLREIEESSFTVYQRLRTTDRMYRTYGFLGLHHN